MTPAATPDYAGLEGTLRAARQGDPRACRRLVAEHQAAVYNLAFRVLGDEDAAVEATQAALASALRELGGYQGGSFRLWLLRWLVAACRLRLGRRAVPQAGAALPASLPARLAALPPAPRLAVALVDIARLDYAQAAAVLGLSPAQLACDLAAARRALSASTGQVSP